MKNTRRAFLKNTTVAAAALPLMNLKLSAMKTETLVNPVMRDGPLREVLFSPGNITEKKNCYDRFELLKKPAQNPVMKAEMPWEGEGGINWGSVIRSPVDGKFKFFYCTDFPGV